LTGWPVERRRAPAAELHAADLPARRGVWLLSATAPALVLGSTQRPDLVRTDADVDVVHRRSGGGVVLVVPGEITWIDVVLPRRDPLWVDDVGRSGRFLAEAWVAALASLGVAGAKVHGGRLECGRWGKLVCFAGLGPGEVLVADGKLVGVSQRRSRERARFQCAVHHRWDAERLVGLLAEPRPEPAELAGVAAVDIDPGDLAFALAAALPS
jgi:lipoate---protein ligase